MPLAKSKSKKAVGKNVDREESMGKPYKESLAIALQTKDRAADRDMGEKIKKKMKKDKKK